MARIRVFWRRLRLHNICEKVEGKITIFLLLILFLILYMLIYYKGANYCVTYVQRFFIVDPRDEASIYKA